MNIISRIRSMLRNWWINYNMTPTERWLSQSSDLGDLENRLRKLANNDTTRLNTFIGETR